MLLWVVLVLGLGVSAVTLPEITDENFITKCVEEHNKARAAVSPPANDMLYMSWDEALAITARAWAKHCDFDYNIHLREVGRMHPTFTSVGENIWMGSPPEAFNVKKAIRYWMDQAKDYDYTTKKCRFMCAHYIQVVWAESYKVGCAVANCPHGVKDLIKFPTAMFVCNYAPGGNFIERQPYATNGEPCSGCKGECHNKMCRSPERDSRTKYNWAPDWDSASLKSTSAPRRTSAQKSTSAPARSSATTSNTFLDILIVRPIALVLTCIAAYAVHYFYPNIFCYE